MTAWLAANKLILYLVLGIIIIAGGWYEVYHLKQAGVAQQQAVDAKVQAVQTAKVTQAEALATSSNNSARATLQVALAAPVIPGIVVRVCQPAALNSRVLVPASASPGPDSTGNTGLPGPVGDPDAAAGIDIAPTTEALLADADAELAYWRAYYQACKKVGACL